LRLPVPVLRKSTADVEVPTEASPTDLPAVLDAEHPDQSREADLGRLKQCRSRCASVHPESEADQRLPILGSVAAQVSLTGSYDGTEHAPIPASDSDRDRCRDDVGGGLFGAPCNIAVDSVTDRAGRARPDDG
jgi:hypothetical protein